MDRRMYNEALRQSIIKQHGGHRTIVSKYEPKYPISAEREYMRMTDAYMAIEKEILLKHIPELKRILSEGTLYHTDSKKDNEKKRKEARFVTIDGTIVQLGVLFDNIQRELEAACGLYNVQHRLTNIAGVNRKLTIAEWKKAISKTLGINILEDYYSGSFYQEALEKWISDNVDLIKTIPKESLGKIKELVYRNYMDGRTNTDIIKELQRQYGVDKRHARLIARDQTGKLNARITRYQQTDAGISRYKWSDSSDARVRDSHKRLNGHIFSWDNPPETDGGRHCHPGEDYQCRCCAIPVFDIDTLDLPVHETVYGSERR